MVWEVVKLITTCGRHGGLSFRVDVAPSVYSWDKDSQSLCYLLASERAKRVSRSKFWQSEKEPIIKLQKEA